MASWKEVNQDDKKFINTLLHYFIHYEKGHLPKSGGVDDQDQFIMMCMPIINKYVNQHDIKGERK